MPLERRRAVREGAEMLSNPPFMSKKREETFVPGRWYDRTLWVRAAARSKVLRPAKEPY